MTSVEPTTFNPSRGRQVYWAFLTAIGLFFVGATLVMPFVDPIRTSGQVVVAVGSLCLFSTVTAGCISALSASRTTVDVDAEGLTWRLGKKVERVHWNDIVSLRSADSDGTSWRIGSRDGRTIKLQTSFLEQREVIKGLLQAKRCELPIADIGSYGYSMALFAGPFLMLMSVAMFAVAYLAYADPTFARPPSEKPLLEGLGVSMGLLMIFVSLHFMTTRFRIEGKHLIRSGILGKRSVLLSLVTEIDLSSSAETSRRSATELMKLRYDGRQIYVTSQLRDYAVLRDRILSLAPQAKIDDRRSMRV